MKECFMCSSNMEVIRDQPYEYKDGGVEITIIGLTQYRCGDCEETFTPIPSPKRLHQVIALTICEENKSILTGKEIKFLRKTMGMKATELADILGVDKSTVSRWENERQEIGDSSDRLLRSLVMLQYKQETTAEHALDAFKGIPAKRKPIKKKHKLSLNPTEWAVPEMPDFCCA